jgi:hypothetical protein
MTFFYEKLIALIWNRVASRRLAERHDHDLDLGFRITDEEITRRRVGLQQSKRAEHIAILGKTGTGKSSLLRYLCLQDIEAGRGFVFFDLHGDATPFLLSAVAREEQRSQRDLSEKLIVIEPADPDYSVGLNPLEGVVNGSFVRIAEFAQLLKQRWHLESFGARTDELLRNSLYAIAENHLTLIELSPFLANSPFRASCLKRVRNAEVRQYFEQRYEQASEPMRAVMREPILNKVSAFTADPQFRHIVGQPTSTFSLLDALDQGRWVVMNLHKGRLGEQAATLGSLLLANIKNALFSRQSRDLFTIYCDEIQNLVAYGSGLETILSEARKFGVSVVSANQYLDQYPPEMRSAILAVGTHVFFQLATVDTQQIAQALDGGKPLAELLKNLPRRRLVVKSGHERWSEVLVPSLLEPKANYADLYERCRKRWAHKRDDIERDIVRRSAEANRGTSEVLHDWE